ncbi:GNAT family N-acetyltransferase [Vagococcus jeotgali]|uniref:GNAT family N-acetyltransferase n=1 Tax=Vagococcus jeotgali TaxID=3109030 RepID=UPI002DD823E9|nr:GNAT family N-acetyltransferase [Vagococcus sp. B2T-5]
MKLVSYRSISNEDILSFKKECLAHHMIIHGSNNLASYSDISTWKKMLSHLEKANYQQRVQSFQYFLVDENKEVLGIADIKPKLNKQLEKDGGHISYSTRPKYQKQGYGKTSLNLLLAEAKRLGLSEVLLTCHQDNEGSKAIILYYGGQLKNTIILNRQIINHYIINL